MRMTLSTSGQASQIRSSTVGRWAEGRTSKYTMPGSLITPDLIRSAMSWSYSAAVWNDPATPAVGQRCQTSVRMLA